MEYDVTGIQYCQIDSYISNVRDDLEDGRIVKGVYIMLKTSLSLVVHACHVLRSHHSALMLCFTMIYRVQFEAILLIDDVQELVVNRLETILSWVQLLARISLLNYVTIDEHCFRHLISDCIYIFYRRTRFKHIVLGHCLQMH